MLFYSHFFEAGREPDGATHLEPANPIKSDINKYIENEKKVKSINTLPSYGGTLPVTSPIIPPPCCCSIGYDGVLEIFLVENF
jgi:hypothetical protein